MNTHNVPKRPIRRSATRVLATLALTTVAAIGSGASPASACTLPTDPCDMEIPDDRERVPEGWTNWGGGHFEWSSATAWEYVPDGVNDGVQSWNNHDGTGWHVMGIVRGE